MRRVMKKARKFAYEPTFFGPIMCTGSDFSEEFCCVKASIRASMKNVARLVSVFLVKETGAVYSASCPCKAGLSGHCSHVGALLLKVAGLKEAACTSRLCSWTAPSNVSKNFTPQPLADINFGDPEKSEAAAPARVGTGTYKASACQDPDQFLADLMSGLGDINHGCVLYKTLGPVDSSIQVFTDLFVPEYCFHDSVDLSTHESEFVQFVENVYRCGSPELVNTVASNTRAVILTG